MYNNGYVRLTALRRDAMPFSPTLRFRSSPFEGGDVSLRSVFCHSERSDESPPFPREIPHCVRNDKRDLNYCCPVKLKKTKSSYSKPFIIGLRGFIFKKQAPLIKKGWLRWCFLSFFGKDVLPCFVGIFHKCDKIDVVHQRKTHHGDNLRESTVSLDAS